MGKVNCRTLSKRAIQKVRRTSRRKFPSYRAKSTFRQYIVPSLAIVGILLYYSQDYWYFNNGSGGTSWQIGTPIVNVTNAYSSRSLPEIRALALELVNRDRLLNGLTPLVEDPLLSRSAQLHAQDMMERQYYAHVTPEGRTPTDRFFEVGGTLGVGENIMQQKGALGVRLTYRLVEQYQKGWMYSDGHRQNLLTPEYRQFGYGIVVNSLTGEVYAVQNFTR